jgi:hypothetical protein
MPSDTPPDVVDESEKCTQRDQEDFTVNHDNSMTKIPVSSGLPKEDHGNKCVQE